MAIRIKKDGDIFAFFRASDCRVMIYGRMRIVDTIELTHNIQNNFVFVFIIKIWIAYL